MPSFDVKSATKPGTVSKLYDALKLYANVFVFEDGQLGSTNVGTRSINTGDSHAYTFCSSQEVEELVDDMLEKKVIHASKSPWTNPVVLVTKKIAIQGFVWTTED